MPWYYLPRLELAAGAVVDVEIEAGEWRHIALASRAQVGQTIHLFNGRGRVYECRLKRIRPRALVVEVLAAEDAARPAGPALELAVAFVPLDSMRRALYGAVAAGIRSFRPFVSERSQLARKRLANTGRIVAALERTAAAACKQAHCPYLPEVAPPVTPEQLLAEVSRAGTLALLADIGPRARPLAQALAELPDLGTAERLCLIIGPEGGFTAREYELAVATGALPVTFAPYVYRTELAAGALAAAVRSSIGW